MKHSKEHWDSLEAMIRSVIIVLGMALVIPFIAPLLGIH